MWDGNRYQNRQLYEAARMTTRWQIAHTHKHSSIHPDHNIPSVRRREDKTRLSLPATKSTPVHRPSHPIHPSAVCRPTTVHHPQPNPIQSSHHPSPLITPPPITHSPPSITSPRERYCRQPHLISPIPRPEAPRLSVSPPI
jgi:hypothetical protein